MGRDYWEGLCNIWAIWAIERWQETSTTMKVNRAANLEANKHISGSVSFATHQSRLEKELKRPPTFQEVFDKTHKKKGTDQYISNRAREVAESYSQQMTEKYAGEEEQPQLDPEVWVAASSAPKKGHVYGFGHSMDTNMVLSVASSLGSQATGAFTTPGALGTSPSKMMGFIRDEISSLESRLVHTMHTQNGNECSRSIIDCNGTTTTKCRVIYSGLERSTHARYYIITQLTSHLITTYSEIVKRALALEAANETMERIRGKSGESSSTTDRKRKFESGSVPKVQQSTKKIGKASVGNKDALGYAMLTTSAAQTRSSFSSALISCVTRLVTVFAVALRWSVGYKNLGFPFLARPLCDVEGMLLAIGRLSR
ncbi:hypothetical protein Taro_054452 [Colocasia esculenta]|uniref:Uncharacterized protein n=1 Tax=Colocasia esculenta TaxID=4460 RepID=A0A843XQI9_COLES|nr:hypothetical protein [Colocasia esculenta]